MGVQSLRNSNLCPNRELLKPANIRSCRIPRGRPMKCHVSTDTDCQASPGQQDRHAAIRPVRSFFAWLKAAAPPRRRGTPRWGPALRAALARRPRAPHRAPRPQTQVQRRRFSPGTLLSAQASLAIYCAVDGRGRHAAGCGMPQASPSPRRHSEDPFGLLSHRHRSRSPAGGEQSGHCSDPRCDRFATAPTSVCPPRAPDLLTDAVRAPRYPPAGAHQRQPSMASMPSQ